MDRDAAGALGTWTARHPVAVTVPDLTRPLDPGPALDALHERLVGGMQVIVGLGLHRRMSAAEMAHLGPWRATQHDPDDVVATETVDGIPGAVGRPLAEAAWSVSVGIAELHQYAGVSGGHKGVAVGCGGRETIAALHHRDRVVHPGVRIGQVTGNPFRIAVDRLGQAGGCRLALVYVPARNVWVAGDPRAVIAEAARLIAPWRSVERRWRGAVLRVPPAKARSLYQASRAATYLALSPRPPLEPGATLVLDARLDEGLGSELGFIQALRREPPPWSGALDGPPPTGAGAQRVVMLALLARRYRLVVRGCPDPAPLLEVGIDASAAPAPSGPNWLELPRPFSEIPQLVSDAPALPRGGR